MVMKESDLVNSKHNIMSVITILLSIIVIVMLSYLFFVKRSFLAKSAELKQQTITLEVNKPITNNNYPARIAIVIAEHGLKELTSLENLPAELTLAFLSDTDEKRIKIPEFLKHNILLELPLESFTTSTENISLETLIDNNSQQTNSLAFELIAEKALNYQGLYSLDDRRAILSDKQVEFLLSNLKKQNFIYLTDNQKLITEAHKIAFPILTKNVILDEVISETAIEERLAQVEQIAREQGKVIAFGNSYPLTIEVIKKWLTTLASKKDIKIVPITEIYEISK